MSFHSPALLRPPHLLAQSVLLHTSRPGADLWSHASTTAARLPPGHPLLAQDLTPCSRRTTVLRSSASPSPPARADLVPARAGHIRAPAPRSRRNSCTLSRPSPALLPPPPTHTARPPPARAGPQSCASSASPSPPARAGGAPTPLAPRRRTWGPRHAYSAPPARAGPHPLLAAGPSPGWGPPTHTPRACSRRTTVLRFFRLPPTPARAGPQSCASSASALSHPFALAVCSSPTSPPARAGPQSCASSASPRPCSRRTTVLRFFRLPETCFPHQPAAVAALECQPRPPFCQIPPNSV